MEEVPLSNYLDYLKAQTPQSLSERAGKVDTYLESHRIHPQDLTPYTHFREDQYARNLVEKTDHFELLLLTWQPGHRTPIHCHAGQRCWMTITEGELRSQNYQMPTSKAVPTLELLGTEAKYDSGEGFYIDDGVGVHEIFNSGTTPAISLHLYAKPIAQCRTYDETTQRFEWRALVNDTEFGKWVRPICSA